MRLVVKHVKCNDSGVWKYRRRVPDDIISVVGKREFKGTIGYSREEALRTWPKFHAEIDEQIAAARRRVGREGSTAPRTHRQSFDEALRQFRQLVRDLPERDDDPDGPLDPRDTMADSILSGYPTDPLTGEPRGVPPEQSFLVNFLRTDGKLAKPDATLNDALREYVKERFAGGRDDADKTAIASAERAVRLVVSALGRDPVLAELSRDDAKEARDFMLDRFKTNGEKVSVSTVDRELNNVRAVVNFAMAEGLLPSGARNVFERLQLPTAGKRSTDAERRDPLPRDVLDAISLRIATAGAEDLGWLWRILAGTGCRLSEVAGLRRCDVVLSGATGEHLPHIRVAWHENRRLKTQASIRCVPLVGDALEAARAALAAATGEMLFPRYGRLRGGIRRPRPL